MSRLASFLTALWLFSAATQPAHLSPAPNKFSDLKNQVTNAVQAALDPGVKIIAFIGGSVCNHVKPLVGVAYENYDNKEPDMSKLTLVLMNSVQNVTYNLTVAAEEIAQECWFNLELPLKIYFHGFTDNPTKDSFQTMSSAFFDQEESKGQVNIMALDASSQIGIFYLRATTMVQFIGEKVGQILATLVDAGLDPKNIHLIGHSLGAHIAGFTGKTFSSLTGSSVGRISGLDPAGPCFGDVNSTLRLSKNDADFVDVIHTDAGVYGLDEQIGHVDFYPNSGSEQPGCLLQTCSHSRVWELYAESVLTPEEFLAVKCNSSDEFRHGQCNYDDTSVMGYGTPASSRGTYYCQTRGEEPFAAGAEGITYNETSVVKAVTNAVKDTVLRG